MLSRQLYMYIRDFDKERQYASDSVKVGKKEIDKLSNEYFYVIRSYFNKVSDEIEEQKNYNAELQKQISSLRKEKGELENFVSILNNKLDEVEEQLGINMQQTRLKLTNNNIMNKEKPEQEI